MRGTVGKDRCTERSVPPPALFVGGALLLTSPALCVTAIPRVYAIIRAAFNKPGNHPYGKNALWHGSKLGEMATSSRGGTRCHNISPSSKPHATYRGAQRRGFAVTAAADSSAVVSRAGVATAAALSSTTTE